MLDTVIKVFESKKWLDRTILVLELLGKKMELPDIWIKAIKDLLTQRDPTGIISIISEKIKVDKDLLMVLAQAVLKKEQPTQIIRNLAKVGRIPDDAIRLIETLIRQITTRSVKGSRSCLSYKIDWSKALTVLNVTA